MSATEPKEGEEEVPSEELIEHLTLLEYLGKQTPAFKVIRTLLTRQHVRIQALEKQVARHAHGLDEIRFLSGGLDSMVQRIMQTETQLRGMEILLKSQRR